MPKKENALVPVGTLKIPKRIQERLTEKMIDMNDGKIIEKVQQRNAHLEAIQRIDKEIEALCTLNVTE